MKAIVLAGMLLACAPAVYCQSLDTLSTPEPSTFVLLSIGIAGIGVAAWRRSKKK